MMTFHHIPKRPGVYLFKDSDGMILYIGKANSLYERVRSYFNEHQERPNVQQLLQHATRIDFIETENEEVALLLEARLIYEQQPKYNVLIKDNQPFIYFYCQDGKKQVRQLTLKRYKNNPGIYIGPFLYKKPVRAAYQFIMREFRLIVCDKKISHGCLRYHIGICAGSCRPDFDSVAYEIRLALALHVLQDDKGAFLDTITERIAHHSASMEFERAQQLLYYKEQMERLFHTIASHGIFLKFSEELIFSTLHTPPNFKEMAEPVARALQKLCGGEKPIYTIDCFDISHMQGKQIVGASIRFENGIAVPKEFRRFKIKSITTQDDYAALQEIVQRRYARSQPPDLILIDGGKGQLNSVKAVGIPVLTAALAKREERLFTDLHSEGILLSAHEETGKLLLALRDYTHHFAISYHRVRRKKSVREV